MPALDLSGGGEGAVVTLDIQHPIRTVHVYAISPAHDGVLNRRNASPFHGERRNGASSRMGDWKVGARDPRGAEAADVVDEGGVGVAVASLQRDRACDAVDVAELLRREGQKVLAREDHAGVVA